MTTIFISGISGVGKSTVSKQLAKDLNFIHINQDNYYLKSKPEVTLSSGLKVKNWDSAQALDFDKLNKDLIEYQLRGRENIILEGFCLRDDLIKIKPDIHIHLSYIPVPTFADLTSYINDFKDFIIPKIIKSRSQAKPGIKNDEIVVKELVWPFYIETLENSFINYVVNTFDEEGNRIKVEVIIDRIKELLKNLNLI